MVRKKKQIKLKEPVRLREKKLKDGNRSLYLDIYSNGIRKYEYLKLYLVPELNELYQREGQISVDTSINGGGGGFGALVGLIATAINTAATDKVVAGRKCNAFVLSDLPAGKYSKMYEADMKSPAGKPLVKATVKKTVI